MIRVLIADDSAFMRKVLSDLFKSQSDFEVVGTAVNGQDAIEKVKKFQATLRKSFNHLVSFNLADNRFTAANLIALLNRDFDA